MALSPDVIGIYFRYGDRKDNTISELKEFIATNCYGTQKCFLSSDYDKKEEFASDNVYIHREVPTIRWNTPNEQRYTYERRCDSLKDALIDMLLLSTTNIQFPSSSISSFLRLAKFYKKRKLFNPVPSHVDYSNTLIKS